MIPEFPELHYEVLKAKEYLAGKQPTPEQGVVSASGTASGELIGAHPPTIVEWSVCDE